MTEPLTAETVAELDEYARAVQQPEDPCMRCGATMSVKPGDATTPLCHDCAHWVLEEYLPPLLAAARRVAELERAQRDLAQVAVEAIRVIHCTTHAKQPHIFEPCEACSLGGVGALRDALAKALGAGYTGLLWGIDMNVDWEELRRRLARSSEAAGGGRPKLSRCGYNMQDEVWCGLERGHAGGCRQDESRTPPGVKGGADG
jgi:hypothetical protein